MKILITGGSGLLGRYLLQTKRDNSIALTYHKNFYSSTKDVTWYHLDVCNRADVFDIFDLFKPDICIHCAAVGSVDFAENKDGYQPVFNVNVTGTKNVIDACNGYKTKIIYISSNAVLSGKAPPYNEKSPLEPINAYGVIKKQAEQTVRDTAKKWLIIRPFLLYGWPYLGGRGNWASMIVDKLRNNGSYKMVHDRIWMPTYAADVAETIWKLLDQDHEVYNVAAPERATLYEFGLKVCEVFELKKNLIKPVESKYFPSIAPRPEDSTYDLVKLSAQGIMLSDIKTGLEKMRAENE